MSSLPVERERQGLAAIPLIGGLGQQLVRLVLGPPVREQVPARVRETIKREQDDSEILVTLIQAGAIVFFYVFYTITPKAFPPNVPFEPIPVALGFYSLFTLLRAWLAITRQLRPAFLVLSVIIDITVLMITIWSFHLQYEAPPAIYLKAPTLMYVFILIALRALRYEPRYVIVGGITASLGWIGMLLYALLVSPQMQVTHSFSEYMMSYSILIGAEVDKIISILMVTAILALVLYRTRKLLYRAAVEQQAAADLSRFFAPEVAGRIKETDEALRPGQAELREAAILFIDMRGFTTITENLSPTDVITILSQYQQVMVASVHSQGGSIDKFMGDGILASFGATRTSSSYAADGVRAIEQVLDAGARWQKERADAGAPAPSVAAALTTGTVVFGTVGDEDRLEYTVIGDPVNLAAKLEKHCKVEGARGIITLETAERSREQGYEPRPTWEVRGDRQVGGVRERLDLMIEAATSSD